MGSSAHPSNPRKPLACRGDRIASARPVACLDSVRGLATHGGFDATAPGVRLVRRVLCLAGAGPTVGRAGLSVQALLVVLPVNFVTLGRSAVFPTVPAPSSTPRRRMRSWRLRPAATSATGRVAGGCESGARPSRSAHPCRAVGRSRGEVAAVWVPGRLGRSLYGRRGHRDHGKTVSLAAPRRRGPIAALPSPPAVTGPVTQALGVVFGVPAGGPRPRRSVSTRTQARASSPGFARCNRCR